MRKRKREVRCAICRELIDQSACGQILAIVTITDDSANSSNLFKRKRSYLCDDCTPKLQIWLMEQEMKQNE